MRGRRLRQLSALIATLLGVGMMLAPAASASTGVSLLPAGFLGLPSLHSIIQAIASGFFSALAGALVPSWLKHGTVATIQQLVALPDPATWAHVGALQGEMTYLGAMLLPVTLAVGAVRYWLVGLTGAAHPATAVVRCVSVTGILVAYRWIVEQAVAGTNTVTHGILGLPAVAGGLQRIIGVLFGGALLTGSGGVFGAFLVIIGVVFAAGLFAAQVLLTVVLAVLVVAGPPLIAVSAIPELSHLARSWADTLLAVALVPLGWTVLFATAGALCLDATSFTGASGGLPGHVAAAFAGLITFVLAVKLPLMMLGEVRHLFSKGGLRGPAPSGAQGAMPGGERVRLAHARLRAVGVASVPSLGRSVGRAAGAMGAPRGGPAGAARRGLGSVGRRAGILGGAATAPAAGGGARSGSATPPPRPPASKRPPMGARVGRAWGILRSAPREAIVAMGSSSHRSPTSHARPASGPPNAKPPRGPGPAAVDGAVASATKGARARAPRPRPGDTAALGARETAPARAAKPSAGAQTLRRTSATTSTPARRPGAASREGPSHQGGGSSRLTQPRAPEAPRSAKPSAGLGKNAGSSRRAAPTSGEESRAGGGRASAGPGTARPVRGPSSTPSTGRPRIEGEAGPGRRT